MKELGKISVARFGFGGYQDAMIGLELHFHFAGGGCSHFIGGWSIERHPNAKWTEEARQLELGNCVLSVGQLLRDARKKDVESLKGTPVEVTFSNGQFESFRVLKEVL